jgi:hypothetical protein
MGTTSNASGIRNGGRPLRLAYPIRGKNTFRPSGNPETDPPEIEWMTSWDLIRPKTRQEQREFDRRVAAIMPCRDAKLLTIREKLLARRIQDECEYWDRVRFRKHLSPRARKRAEVRDAKRDSLKVQKQRPSAGDCR